MTTSLDAQQSEVQFRRLYEAHAASVRRYLGRRASPGTADELASDTWTVVWSRIGDVPQTALPWIIAVARNTLHAHYRREGNRLAAERRSAVVADQVDVGDRMVALEALRDLPPADRELLCLVAWDGMDIAECAVVLGASCGAVRVRLMRARRRLERAMSTSGRDVAEPICREEQERQ